ncbi:MAG: NfeD family protein [Bacteroidales bacterium]|nr:NfeD family protein [Bacteroidales bacterium]
MKEFFTLPVIWFLAGLVLSLLEIIIPGLIIFFFGLGAWVVALAVVIFPEIGLTAQFAIFGISAVLGLVLLRQGLQNRFFKENQGEKGSLEEEFIGKTGQAETDLKKGIPGKISFRGTQWTAVSDCDISKGQMVKVVSKDSITLKVTHEN